VLDNAAGSGTTGIACMNTGRQFVMMEKDPVAFETMTNRIKSTNQTIT
jgi:site-specific DNA-methyltransferase (adenine-specific)